MHDKKAKIVRLLMQTSVNHKHLVNELYSDDAIKAAITRRLIAEFDMECAELCRIMDDSNIFRNIDPINVDKFTWSACIDILLLKAPIMLQVVQGIVSLNDCRNKTKLGSHHNPGICTAIAVLLKERNVHMVGIQSIISLMLMSSHANKLVSQFSVSPINCTCTIFIVHTCTCTLWNFVFNFVI